MTDNDENGQCRQCGRDNRGYENDPCSDDCPLYDDPAVRLAAFAPDLLAALEDVLADFDHAGLRGLIHTHWGSEKEISMRQSIATARAAISKAKGA